MIVRAARPDELPLIADLRVAAFRADGYLAPASAYAPILRNLGADGCGEVLAAVDGGLIVGTVMLQFWPDGEGEVSRGPGEAEVRALAVAPSARGQGIGRSLVTAVTELAVTRQVRHLLLLTRPEMHAAQRLYTGAGFTRLPDRDTTIPNGILIAFGLRLPAGPATPATAGA